MEVSALLAGRTEVTMDDLAAARYGIAIVPADEELFDRQLATWQAHWIEKSKRYEIEKELDAITQLTLGVPEVLDLAKHLLSDLKTTVAEYGTLRSQIESLTPSSVDAHSLRNKKLQKIDEHLEACQIDLIAKLSDHLPKEVPADADMNRLTHIKGITKQILEELNAIASRTDRARDLRAAAIDVAIKVSAEVEVAMIIRSGHKPLSL